LNHIILTSITTPVCPQPPVPFRSVISEAMQLELKSPDELLARGIKGTPLKY